MNGWTKGFDPVRGGNRSIRRKTRNELYCGCKARKKLLQW